MTTKESIIVAYLEFLADHNDKNSGKLFPHIAIIRMHLPGYEQLVEDYSKQIIDILKGEE